MRSKRLLKWLTPIFWFGVMVLVLIYSAPLAKGIGDGITLCLTRLIPSLFAFMIISSFLMSSGIAKRMLRFAVNPIAKLFCVPQEVATIFLLSLIGGYPIGAKLLSDGVKRGEIAPETAQRALAYTVNCGPAFLICAVSYPLFGNRMTGVIITLSQVFAATMVGILSRRRQTAASPFCPASQTPRQSLSYSSLLIQSVESTIRSLALICGFCCLCSGVIEVFEQVDWFDKLSRWLSPLSQTGAKSLLLGMIEVTNGCDAMRGAPSFFVILLITGFGGLSVHLQIKGLIGRLKIRYFYGYRPVYLCFSLLFGWVWVRFFGGSIAVFGIRDQMLPKPNIVSPFFSILLILLSVSLLLSLKKFDTIKETKQENNLHFH